MGHFSVFIRHDNNWAPCQNSNQSGLQALSLQPAEDSSRSVQLRVERASPRLLTATCTWRKGVLTPAWHRAHLQKQSNRLCRQPCAPSTANLTTTERELRRSAVTPHVTPASHFAQQTQHKAQPKLCWPKSCSFSQIHHGESTSHNPFL